MSSRSDDVTRSGAAAIGRAAAIVGAALDCIISMDESGNVVEFNPAAERTFGWTRQEALGQPLHDLIIPEELREAHVRGLAHLLATGEGPVLHQRLELPAVRRDGSRLSVELIVVPTPGVGGYEFTGFVRDITELRETQERLRRSEARYEAIARNSNRALILCRPGDGDTTFVTGERVLGFAAGTPLPGGFLTLVHDDDREAAQAFLEEVAQGLRPAERTVDLRLRTADGSYLLCEVMSEDFRDNDAIQALMLRASDVTSDRAHRRERADAAARMRTLIDQLASGVVLEDEEHRVLVLNKALLELFGINDDVDALAGMEVTRVAEAVMDRFTDPAAFLRGVDERIASGAATMGEELVLADGRTLERDYVPVRSLEREAGHLWVYRDVSHRAEEQRRLAEQNRSLAELSSLKNEFVATVSHELRTPLTSVVSFSELLADPSVGELNDEQRQFLQIVERNAHKLLRLIDDLLLVAKLEARTLPMVPGRIATADLVRELVDETRPRADAAGVALDAEIDESVWLEGDVVRLQQVVANLLGNAVAYTPEGGAVRVTSGTDDDHWVLSIADTGVGIPAAELDGIFNAFQRASTSVRSSHHGTGLGLAISRLIVEQHGGTLSAESEVGRGTTMTVRLPRGEG